MCGVCGEFSGDSSEDIFTTEFTLGEPKLCKNKIIGVVFRQLLRLFQMKVVCSTNFVNKPSFRFWGD